EEPADPAPAAPPAAAFSPVHEPAPSLGKPEFGAELASLPPMEERRRPARLDEAGPPPPAASRDPRPAAGTPPEAPGGLTPPAFDLVRVERDGTTIIAGRADPDVQIDISFDGEVRESVRTSSRGDFVAMLFTELKQDPQELRLIARAEGPAVTYSEDTVIVLAPPPAAEEAETPALPAVVRAGPERVELVQPPRPGGVDQVVLDTISYDKIGAVVLSGRGRPDASLRIYTDNRNVATLRVSPTGEWQAVLPDIAPGRYTLRIDELDRTGTRVSSRMETPFQRDIPADIRGTDQALPAVVREEVAGTIYVVQPGNNLWRIARKHLGKGIRYTYIFMANRDQIRDPDLIYPGQIFDIPPRAVVEAQDRRKGR
ncbi:MAG: LysM peptidoglycan-binding domain-containing protein, partial [Alphaproteobacteria bacterium]